MIHYERTNWYGLSYLCRLRGSLLPRVLPCMIIAGVVAWIAASDTIDTILGYEGGTFRNETFEHPYAFQLFGIVFGYLTVARLNWSYNRYWEGVTHIKVMHSKWADACTQVLAFDRLDDSEASILDEPFCRHMARLFCQMSAFATMRLHVESEPGKDGGRASWLDAGALSAKTGPLKQGPKHVRGANAPSLKGHSPQSGAGLMRKTQVVSLKQLPTKRSLSSPDLFSMLPLGTARKMSIGTSDSGGNTPNTPSSTASEQRTGFEGLAQLQPPSPGGKRNARRRMSAPGMIGARGGGPVGDSTGAEGPKKASYARRRMSAPAGAIAGAGGPSAGRRSDSGAEGAIVGEAALATAAGGGVAPPPGRALARRPSLVGAELAKRASSAIRDASPQRKQDRKREKLQRGLTTAEAAFHLGRAKPGVCPVLGTMQRIIRAISTRQRAGGLRAPPPIVSRIFQELSNGLLAYNNATKLKEIPVPFAFVQFNALLQLFFVFCSPLVIASFTSLSVFFSVLASVIVVGGFVALWLVANELEDPFGYDANDMPMVQYHEDFCASLDHMLASPWMEEDQWVVSSGPWQQPSTNYKV